jgi:hypothetical protein
MNMMRILPAFALTALLLPAGATVAQAAIRTGTLTCDIAGGVGMIIASSKAVSCRFTDFNGNTELYTGDIRKFGVDLGMTYAGRVVWAVFEPAVGSGALAGSYTGVSAEATAGVGLGANVLVGGGNGGVTLQPLSVQGQTGFNVAAGIGSLNIEPAAMPVVERTVVGVHHRRYGYHHRRWNQHHRRDWHRHHYATQHHHYRKYKHRHVK